jgi:hypothetical protein
MGLRMRTYIFTPREREVIRGFLKGKVAAKDHAVRVITSRVRVFKELSSDVDLYLELRRRLAEPEAAVSA